MGLFVNMPVSALRIILMMVFPIVGMKRIAVFLFLQSRTPTMLIGQVLPFASLAPHTHTHTHCVPTEALASPKRRQDALKDVSELEIDREREREEEKKWTVRNEVMKEAVRGCRGNGGGGERSHRGGKLGIKKELRQQEDVTQDGENEQKRQRNRWLRGGGGGRKSRGVSRRRECFN